MNRFLLKNDTTENVSARVTVSPSDELGNLGHDAATVIEGDRLTTCLAPTAVALPEPTGHRSQCFELNDNGRYAVEINGVVQPYAFTPADLMDCFNGQHESQVRFLECMRPAISCDGATNQVSLYHSLSWVGESDTIFAIFNDDTGEEVISIQGYYLNYPDYDMSKLINPNVDYVTAIPYTDSSTTEYDNYRTTTQGVTYRNTSSEPLRLRIEVSNYGGGGDAWDGFVNPETELHHNPTFNTIFESSEKTIHVVCLAPMSKPEIICDGATSSFQAKSSLATNEIEVSIDGGPWTDIYSAEGIFVSFVPGNPGADIRFNLDGSEPKRVRVRTSRDIGLYVNPLTGFNQINTNKAYTLYDRNGVMIDPFDPDNHDYSGAEFDDTATTDDYAVFFAEAEFCLATESEEWVDLITFKTDGKEITAKEGNGQGESLRLINVDTGEVELGLPHFNLLTPGNYKLQFLSGEDISNWAVVVKGKGLTEITDWCTYGDVLAYTCDSSPNLIKVPSYAPTQTNSLNMFLAGCTILNDPNISNWDVSKFTDMGYMFAGCKAFNQPLDQWDVSNVTYMGYMFNGATAFNQDLSDWCVAKIATKPIGFDGGAEAFVLEHKPVWGTCPNGS